MAILPECCSGARHAREDTGAGTWGEGRIAVFRGLRAPGARIRRERREAPARLAAEKPGKKAEIARKGGIGTAGKGPVAMQRNRRTETVDALNKHTTSQLDPDRDVTPDTDALTKVTTY